MTLRTFRTAVLAAGMTSIAVSLASGASASGAGGQADGSKKAAVAAALSQTGAGQVQCYLLGCYDGQGNRVERPAEQAQPQAIKAAVPADAGTAATTAAKGAAAVAAAKAPAGVKYHEIVTRHASAHGVPVGLAHAVIRIESNYRVNARGRAGEIGLMQIKPATARMMGYSGSAKGLYDPDTNIKYGMKYLAMAQRLSDGSLCGTILKYNAGHAAKRMNSISAAYCTKVKRHMAGA